MRKNWELDAQCGWDDHHLHTPQEGAQKAGLMLDSNEELYKWFTQQVMLNLHIVFTMNPSGDGLKDKCSTSPALFNR
jgi:dynein heavy chain 1